MTECYEGYIIALHEHPSESCHIGVWDHNDTMLLMPPDSGELAPRLILSQTGRYSIFLPLRDGRLS